LQGHGVIRPVDALGVLCAHLTRDLFAIAEFLYTSAKQFRRLLGAQRSRCKCAAPTKCYRMMTDDGTSSNINSCHTSTRARGL